MANGEEWLTVNQAAAVSGYHLERVRESVRDGKIAAQKFGPVWVVYRGSLMEYLDKMLRAGKKRGRKPHDRI